MTKCEMNDDCNEYFDKSAIDFIITCYIEAISKKKDLIVDIRKITTIYSPSELDDILQEKGWERLDFDSNGWQQDTWYWYAHPDFDFELTMAYSGFYGDLKLYRRDIDD